MNIISKPMEIHTVNINYIHAAIERIEAINADDIKARQELLVALLAEMVDNETSEGEGTELHTCLEGQDWWQTLKAITRDAGFYMLGNGHFSAAYGHKLLPGRVIKVGFKKEDSGAAYTAFCRMHQGRAGIPNIYDVQRHAGCYTVVLDMLENCNRYDNDEHDKYADISRDVIECKSEDYNELEGFDADFVETCKMIRKFFEGIASFDMHAGNIMFDEFDTPYITDPVSFTAKDKALSIEPEELLQEIEQLAAEKIIDKAIERHNRKVNRAADRKERAKARKRAIRARKQQSILLRKIRFEAREVNRNEDRMRLMIGTGRWAQRWCFHNNADIRALEAKAAAQARVHDMVAIQAGGDLWIDKKIDAMFMG